MLFCICKFYKLNLSAPLSPIFTTFTIPERHDRIGDRLSKLRRRGNWRIRQVPGEASLESHPNTIGRIDRWIFSCGYRRFPWLRICIFCIAWEYYSNCCLRLVTWDAMSVGYDKHVHPIPSNFVPGLKIAPPEFLIKHIFKQGTVQVA